MASEEPAGADGAHVLNVARKFSFWENMFLGVGFLHLCPRVNVILQNTNFKIKHILKDVTRASLPPSLSTASLRLAFSNENM